MLSSEKISSFDLRIDRGIQIFLFTVNCWTPYMIPRECALTAPSRFYAQKSNNCKIDNISVDRILRLARIVLDINTFASNDKYYRQIKGGAMGSRFTMVLANIYMLEWEKSLINDQTPQKELYAQ